MRRSTFFLGVAGTVMIALAIVANTPEARGQTAPPDLPPTSVCAEGFWWGSPEEYRNRRFLSRDGTTGIRCDQVPQVIGPSVVNQTQINVDEVNVDVGSNEKPDDDYDYGGRPCYRCFDYGYSRGWYRLERGLRYRSPIIIYDHRNRRDHNDRYDRHGGRDYRWDGPRPDTRRRDSARGDRRIGPRPSDQYRGRRHHRRNR